MKLWFIILVFNINFTFGLLKFHGFFFYRTNSGEDASEEEEEDEHNNSNGSNSSSNHPDIKQEEEEEGDSVEKSSSTSSSIGVVAFPGMEAPKNVKVSGENGRNIWNVDEEDDGDDENSLKIADDED